MTARTFWIMQAAGVIGMVHGQWTYNRLESFLSFMLMLLAAAAVVKQSEVK